MCTASTRVPGGTGTVVPGLRGLVGQQAGPGPDGDHPDRAGEHGEGRAGLRVHVPVGVRGVQHRHLPGG